MAPGSPGFSFHRSRLADFHDLMRHRIMDILLVASPYDAFLLEEAGELSERVRGEFRNLDLHYGPGLTTVSTGAEALAAARHGRHGLIISALQLSDMSGDELARQVRAEALGVPVVLLAYDNRELREFSSRADLSAVERVFLWQGDARILLAVVKSVEDRANVAHDTAAAGVQVIVVIEDNVRYYSSFLPAIYGELLQHSQRLLGEALNSVQKIRRMRARPKILLCSTYEEAWQAFTRYERDVLGVVSDVEFPRQGRWQASAGLDFALAVKESWPDVPILLHSSRPENAAAAQAIGADFLQKGSPLLLSELARFMLDNFGFGDFVFRLPDGNEVGRAADLRGLEEELRRVPAESVAYHAVRNHFSKWLKARTEFALAHELRPRKVSDFATVDDLRQLLIGSIARYRRRQAQLVVADFERGSFEPQGGFWRVGGGSLGGKARGLAFMRRLLAEAQVEAGLEGVEVGVPDSVVLGTDVFDRFLEQGDLRSFAMDAGDDAELLRRFEAAAFPEDTREDLRAFLERVRYPLAVRSSSLLEDSRYQPFTGVYETYMVPNNAPSLEQRLQHLLRAIQRVYASTFSQAAKSYVHATPYRLEEEKMAVILQRLVGRPRGPRFYPDFSGVARSHNFYPHAPLTAQDGIAAVALGLGRSVVTEGNCLRFCPRHPQHVVQFSTPKDLFRNSQRAFWALDLEAGLHPEQAGLSETRYELDVAEADGALLPVASTWSAENDRVYDGLSRPGVRLVTFAPVLKHGLFPLAALLQRLLEVGRWGLGTDVEIEFAVDLQADPGRPREFAFLQLRPLALSRESEELQIGQVEPGRALVRSAQVLGNGRVDDLLDLLVVDRERFDRAHSRRAAQELGELNAALVAEGRPYLLIGVGRWGSSDPWLGIPVAWNQISGARVIVEAGFADFRVTPSQGTHFFQNLTSFNVGYFTVNPDRGEGEVDWAWLRAQPAARETGLVRHVRLERPVTVKMNGKTHEGVVLKPE